MSYNVINDLASEVLEETKKNLREDNSENYGIDPLTIIIIIGILVNVIRVVQECRKDKDLQNYKFEPNIYLKDKNKTKQIQYTYMTTEVRSQATNCGWFAKRRIRKIIKEKLTPEQYKKYGEALLQALLVIGTKATDEQVCSLMEYQNV
jgi:hypothetical protein